MLSILSWLGSFLSGPLTALTGQITGVMTNSKKIEAQEFSVMTLAQQAEYVAALQAQTELNQAKISNSWWGAHLMILLFGIPPALHMGAVYLDAGFFGGGHIKSVPPTYADAEFKIALSFFILAPTLAFGAPIFSSLAQRIRGK